MFSRKWRWGVVGLLVMAGLCVFGGGAARGDGAAAQSPPAAAPASAATTEGATAKAAAALEATPPDASAAAAGKPTIRITLEQGILMAVDHNPDIILERLKPAIQATTEDQERAVFDPVLAADLSQGWNWNEKIWEENSVLGPFNSPMTTGDISLEEYLPTGTKLTLSMTSSTQRATFLTKNAPAPEQFTSLEAGLTATQSLLKGMGLGPNLAKLHEAQLDTQGSEYQFRGIIEAFVAQVEETYWDYALTSRQIEIVVESLKVAEQQLSDTQARVNAGGLPATEVAAAQAEVALRREDLINARSNLAKVRLRLLRLLSPEEPNSWVSEVTLLDQPTSTGEGLGDVEDHVRVALLRRPDLNQARLAVKRGDLEIVRTKNGLLPKLDVFINIGSSAYASSFSPALNDYDRFKSYEATVGANFEYPLINRDARAQYQRAMFSRVEARKAVENLGALAQVDVRSAYVEATRAEDQIAATAETRQFKGEALRAETEKFRVGRSTSFLVAQAQRDYLASQIGEVEAVVTHLKALAELYRLEGSLLMRRGIVAPGAETVDSF